MQHAQGIAAPEHTMVAASNLPEEAAKAMEELNSVTHERAEPLDHNARLYFELDPDGKGNNLYSFYSEYQDYLDDRNMIDVSWKLSVSPKCVCGYSQTSSWRRKRGSRPSKSRRPRSPQMLTEPSLQCLMKRTSADLTSRPRPTTSGEATALRT